MLIPDIAPPGISRYRAGRCLNGIVYFHRISDVRVGGASRRNLTIFQKLCGEEVFANVAIVTTRWDQEDEAVGNERLAQLKAGPRLFESIIAGGGSVERHDGSYDSACRVLRRLISGTPKPLLIQREMVSEGKGVVETTAGQELQHDIVQQVERHRKELTELLEEMAQSRDASALKELEEECQVLRERIVHFQTEAGKLDGTSRTNMPEPLAPGILTELPPNPSIANHSPPQLSNRLPTVGTAPDDWDRTVEGEMGQVRELRVGQNNEKWFVKPGKWCSGAALGICVTCLIFIMSRAWA